MANAVVHRIIEDQAARCGDAAALVQNRDFVTYRDLNHRANAIARHLIDAGFRRGGHALVNMPYGCDLATVLLGVLKAGGAYTWVQPCVSNLPSGAAVASAIHAEPGRYRPIDLSTILRQPAKPGPNLPILTRAADVACVLTVPGDPHPVLVPHATIAALRGLATTPQSWEGDATTFDLWSGLMAGETLSLSAAPALLDAA